MAFAQGRSFVSPLSVVILLLSFLSFSIPALAETRWIQYTGNDGTIWLDDDRQPALYTKDFGDCQGNSLINVTRFDAAYYKDNMTVQFHLAGNSPLTGVQLMMSIAVYAYGEPRFSLLFNPCVANIYSLCPLNATKPINAHGIIPIAQSDVAGIPSIALSIPDFEGQAILRIFSNSTQSQIACFSAVLTNGATMAHPTAIGSVLAIFTLVALIASVAVAVYGTSASDTRQHYAHSLSVFVVFSVFQHIFFTGALSMNWPSVLVAFWSNFAWSGGIIYWEKMQDTINNFIGENRGNISMVGAAPAGQNSPDLGGGYQINQIYKRALVEDPMYIYRRATSSNTTSLASNTTIAPGFSWYGKPVRPGLPLPGNYSGFAGTLAQLDIPASNAFMTGFLWFLILLAAVIVAALLLKGVVEALVASRLVRSERLITFRQRWVQFVIAIVLRTCYIAFFSMMFLTLFQFTLGGAVGVRAIAAVVFALFLVGMMGVAAYALYLKLRGERLVWGSKPQDASDMKVQPEKPLTNRRRHQLSLEANSRGWYPFHFTDSGKTHVHDDEAYMANFGWLSARFRRSKWWFFAFWLVYEFGRACFFGAAAGYAFVQVFGLLAWEILALCAIVLMKPFESNRLNLLMVYLLGFSKVVTVALSSAFDTRFALNRILCTVIGIIIVVIQGVLTICLLIAIVVGAISTYMSLTRNHEEIKPKALLGPRARYFAHVDLKATDQPPPPPPTPPEMPEKPKGPYFAVSSVRREPKIEDEDPDQDIEEEVQETRISMDPEAEKFGHQQTSRAQSIRSRNSASNLPYGARRHRASWSTRDLQDSTDDIENFPNANVSRMSTESFRDAQTRHRAASVRTASRNEISRPASAVYGENTRSQRGGRHGRSSSNPQRPMHLRKSSMVNEEMESYPPYQNQIQEQQQNIHQTRQ